MKKSNIWIVIPAFNEERYLSQVLRKTKSQHSQIIVVSDGSVDKTNKIASKKAKYFLNHKVNLGKGATIKTGCRFAFEVLDAKAVILMDADDQHNPQEIQKFLEKLQGGSQMVFGIRNIYQSMPIFKRFANLSLSRLVFLLFGKFIPDIPSGFRAMTKKTWKKLNCQATGYEIETEMAVRVAKEKINFDTVCISTIYHDMNKGMTFLDALKLISPIINWKFNI